MLKFEDTNPNGIANKVVNEIRAAFKAKLDEEKSKKILYAHAKR
jgi:hypothetical protein